MIALVGLGNPGEKYRNNRHNVGCMFIDYIAPLLNCSIVKKRPLYSTIKSSNNRTIILVKPTTFMNNSGQAVKSLISHFSLSTSHLIVLHDDLDIPLGKFKIQKGRGPELHNGIESIEKALLTKDFWRVRIGIDNRRKSSESMYHLDNGRGKDDTISKQNDWIDGETYVLQDFKADEKKILTDLFPKIAGRLTSFFSAEVRR